MYTSIYVYVKKRMYIYIYHYIRISYIYIYLSIYCLQTVRRFPHHFKPNFWNTKSAPPPLGKHPAHRSWWKMEKTNGSVTRLWFYVLILQHLQFCFVAFYVLILRVLSIRADIPHLWIHSWLMVRQFWLRGAILSLVSAFCYVASLRPVLLRFVSIMILVCWWRWRTANRTPSNLFRKLHEVGCPEATKTMQNHPCIMQTLLVLQICRWVLALQSFQAIAQRSTHDLSPKLSGF